MEVVPDGAPATERADPARFTGLVWRTGFIVPPDDDHLAGSRFDYEPGARSYWHVHEREQAIVVVHGRGLVAWEGLEAPVALAPGDWWHVEPGVAHWHGATPRSPFSHLAITAGGGTAWQHEVSEAEYRVPPGPPPG